LHIQEFGCVLRNPVSEKKFSSDIAVIGYIAGIKLILQLAAINGYGYFRDEFYCIACSQNLSFGYVDHPPLAMMLLKGIRTVLGDSIFALRMVPALCGFLFIFEAGRTDCEYCMPYENNQPIFICRGLKSLIKDFWPKVKNFN